MCTLHSRSRCSRVLSPCISIHTHTHTAISPPVRAALLGFVIIRFYIPKITISAVGQRRNTVRAVVRRICARVCLCLMGTRWHARKRSRSHFIFANAFNEPRGIAAEISISLRSNAEKDNDSDDDYDAAVAAAAPTTTTTTTTFWIGCGDAKPMSRRSSTIDPPDLWLSTCARTRLSRE